jgi:DNA-binding Xre family transcriptional regulator
VTRQATRQVGYQWRLREVMAAHGMFSTTELVPLLADRGITLSVSQVHRLATGVPERLSLQVLAALCDIFACTPAELIATRAEPVADRPAAAVGAVADLAELRPKRARLRPQ